MQRTWISRVKDELKQSPLASNVVFGFILVGLEKLVEMEFTCPCNPQYNAAFASAYFVVPTVLVFLLTISIQGTKCRKWSKECGTAVANSCAPAIVWLLLVFMDGHYFACAMTFWSGRFVVDTEAASQKWCKPANQTLSQEFMIKTQKWIFLSQGIGMVLISVFTLVFGGYVIFKCVMWCKETDYSRGQNRGHREEEVSEV